MGNYSYFQEQRGCELDVDKLRVLDRLNSNNTYISDEENANTGKKLESDTLGEYMDGWKIQGYWYDYFVEFIYDCADCMNNLTDRNDNFILMEEEQGFKFYIYFFRVNGKTVVEVNYVPMEWKTMILKRGLQK